MNPFELIDPLQQDRYIKIHQIIMRNKNSRFNVFLISILIFLGILSRIIPHPDNFTAIGAVALFGGAYAKKQNINFLIPMLAILISNVLLLFIQNKPLPTLPLQIIRHQRQR